MIAFFGSNKIVFLEKVPRFRRVLGNLQRNTMFLDKGASI